MHTLQHINSQVNVITRRSFTQAVLHDGQKLDCRTDHTMTAVYVVLVQYLYTKTK